MSLDKRNRTEANEREGVRHFRCSETELADFPRVARIIRLRKGTKFLYRRSHLVDLIEETCWIPPHGPFDLWVEVAKAGYHIGHCIANGDHMLAVFLPGSLKLDDDCTRSDRRPSTGYGARKRFYQGMERADDVRHSRNELLGAFPGIGIVAVVLVCVLVAQGQETLYAGELGVWWHGVDFAVR